MIKMSSSDLVRSVDFTNFYLLFVGARVTPPLYCVHLFPRIRASRHQYIFCLSAASFVKIIETFSSFLFLCKATPIEIHYCNELAIGSQQTK